MTVEIIEMLLSFIGAMFFITFIGIIVGGGMALICRPLDHQFEWEKKMRGLNSENREIEATKRQECDK